MQLSILKEEIFDENDILIKDIITVNLFKKNDIQRYLSNYVDHVKNSNIDHIKWEDKGSIKNSFFCMDINVFIENKDEEHNCVFLNIDSLKTSSINFFYAQKHKSFELKSNLTYIYDDKKYIFIDLNFNSDHIASKFNLIKKISDLNPESVKCIYELSKNGKLSHLSKNSQIESFYLKNSLKKDEVLKTLSQEIIEKKEGIEDFDHRGAEFPIAFNQSKNLKFEDKEKCIKIEDDESSLIIPFKNIPFYQCRKRITYTTMIDIPNDKKKEAELNFYQVPIYLVDIEINNFKKTLYLFEYQYEKFKKLYSNIVIHEKRPIITL